MKKDIHPKNYRIVLFEDAASGTQFLIGSTVATTEEGKGPDGKMYPKYSIEISSVSHPFYTGENRTIDKGGRVERFNKKRLAAKGAH